MNALNRNSAIMNETEETTGEGQGRLPFRKRLAICASILLVGMACAAPHPGAILLVPFYPLGFDKFLGITEPNGGGIFGYIAFAIAITTVLSVARRSRFMVCCVLLAILCGLTTTGCRRVLEDLSGIV